MGPAQTSSRDTKGRRARGAAAAADRMQLRGIFFILLLALIAISSAARNKKEKGKKGASDCTEWQWGPCTPNSKDCGVGFREGTCKEETGRLKCKIPCNWKKEFGADCKYKFESWGGCDAATGLKARSGTLKKSLYNAECQETIQVTKPCSPKIKSKPKGKKVKGKE
ncbi:midkine isoform X2 [Rhinatrema bivittatum]|uniref:midkine isoform X2 n=1 Tax=Rhinatrema bivittatum TaxID=194408 RepID=UPI00112CBB14|nr:midkine isoform X2 [Rhinatrema bivittatum]